MLKIKRHIFPTREINEIYTADEYGGKPGAYIIVCKSHGMPLATAILYDSIEDRDKDFRRIHSEMAKKELKK